MPKRKSNLDLVQDLLRAASQAILDFDTWGETWQLGYGDTDNYGPTSTVERLRSAIIAINPRLVRSHEQASCDCARESSDA